MRKIVSAAEMEKISREARAAGQKIAFVPTMGSLHEGHLALLREGRKRGDLLVVSIFVNPTQFNNREDFEKYPRDLESDLEKCRREKVDIVFAPAVEEMYPPGEKEREIPLPSVARTLEGKARPGHFAGVIRIVSKLFRVVEPHFALFGLKDYQQLRVIQETVKEQGIAVTIVPYPIVRTPEGLAMSSRNTRLSPAGLQSALILSRSLKAGEALFLQGERDVQKIREEVEKELIADRAIRIDYVAVVDAETLEEISVIRKPALVAIAAFVEGIRLIDNCLLNPVEVRDRTR